MSSSMDSQPTFSDTQDSCEAIFDETLSLMATLYRSKTKGVFQEKAACLVVRIKKTAPRRGQVYQGTSCIFVCFLNWPPADVCQVAK